LAFWEYDAGGEEHGVSVINANVAIHNPFYAVPLYNEIFYRDEKPRDQSIRVRTSYPPRVEIVDDVSGRLLAVDATGNGDFTGSGDLVFRDNNRDGFPDLRLSAEDDFAALLLFGFPEPDLSGVEALEVTVDLFDDGEWRPAGRNRFILD
jgi:hypothetical protein